MKLVFLNGVLLVPGRDYTIISNYSIEFTFTTNHWDSIQVLEVAGTFCNTEMRKNSGLPVDVPKGTRIPLSLTPISS